MPPTFKTLSTGTIATGSYVELEWTPDRDITIKKMMINERTNQSLNSVLVYISIADEPYTKEYVPATVIGTSTEYAYKPDLRVTKGAKVYVKTENQSGADRDLDVVFEYE